MVNKANLLLNAGTIYQSTDWDGTTYADGSWTNEDETLAALEAFNYASIGSFTDFSIFHSRENEKVLESDQCGVWEFYRAAELTPRAEFTWQEVWDLDRFATFLGLKVQNVAGTPVAITNEAVGTTVAAGTIYTFANKNWDNTQVASITASDTGWALVLNTDYTLWVDDEGNTYMVILLATTGATVVNYTYTPNASKLSSYKTQQKTTPYSLIKFVTCPNDEGEFDVHYLVKVAPTAEVQMQFVNLARSDFAGTSMTLSGAKWGNYLWKKQTLTPIA